MQSKYFINSQSARDYKREFTGVPNTYKEVFESKKYKNRFYKLKMKKIINYTQSSFTKWIDFKSRTSRIEFFTGLVTSGLFFFFNIILSLNLASYFRVNTWFHLINLYILIAILFAFIQIHSLVARRLNDISVNPFFAFIPFLLASSYLLLKSFYDLYEYGQLIFIVILFVIVAFLIMIVSEGD
jgi:uncharacterized membrane protein YhaH (DUF805 family)